MPELVPDPLRSDILYSVNDQSGIQKSTDGGRTWTAANDGLPTGFVGSLVIRPYSPETLFIGTSQGIYKSIDGGRHWFPVLPVDGVLLHSLVIDPTNADVVYAGIVVCPYCSTEAIFGLSACEKGGCSVGGIFRSADGGRTWHLISTGSWSGGFMALDPARPNLLYVWTIGGGSVVAIPTGQ